MENTQPRTLYGMPLPSTAAERKAQIIWAVEQCFAIQDTYGKTPRQLKILMDAMVLDLSQYPADAVSAAFTEWRRTASKIPTPADIIRLTEAEMTKRRRLEELQAPNQDTPQDRVAPTEAERAEVARIVAQAAAALRAPRRRV
jgi:hypothetical protein